MDLELNAAYISARRSSQLFQIHNNDVTCHCWTSRNVDLCGVKALLLNKQLLNIQQRWTFLNAKPKSPAIQWSKWSSSLWFTWYRQNLHAQNFVTYFWNDLLLIVILFPTVFLHVNTFGSKMVLKLRWHPSFQAGTTAGMSEVSANLQNSLPLHKIALPCLTSRPRNFKEGHWTARRICHLGSSKIPLIVPEFFWTRMGLAVRHWERKWLLLWQIVNLPKWWGHPQTVAFCPTVLLHQYLDIAAITVQISNTKE